MELIAYDKETKTSTVKLTDVELVDLNELVLGAINTQQDYAALGVQKERLRVRPSPLHRFGVAEGAEIVTCGGNVWAPLAVPLVWN